jgi:hypothetical protein
MGRLEREEKERIKKNKNVEVKENERDFLRMVPEMSVRKRDTGDDSVGASRR